MNEKEIENRPENVETASHGKAHFEIQIDRKHYTVIESQMTGAQLRALPTPAIGPDRDFFEVVPGGTDRKIGDSDVVEMRNGLRFFSAPAQINPGL
jgi:Multiubiquitin